MGYYNHLLIDLRIKNQQGDLVIFEEYILYVCQQSLPMTHKLILAFFFCLLVGIVTHAQSITIRETEETILIDGNPDDAAWLAADSAYSFMQQFPSDTSLAGAQTVARLLYDDEFIYVMGIMSNKPGTRKYVTPSLRRDFHGAAHDSFTVIFDTFSDRTNGYIFGVNPFGVMREGLISSGGNGRGSFSLDWDNKWVAQAQQYDGYWVVEMAIPFKTLRFSANDSSWKINFYRVDSEYAEMSTWTPVKQNFPIFNLGSNRTMTWDKPTPEPGTNLSIIPYVSAHTQEDFGENTRTGLKADAGFDIKYAITSGLNLDLTFNPDFSQVEVDQQVTNLDRFEIFFPERRQFFLENADLFSSYGNRGTRPFFSRRIGVAKDTATGQNVQNPIPIGARLSGKLNNNLRLGLLSIQAGRDKDNGLPSYNYSVLTLQQKILNRSNISFLLINKQTFEDKTEYASDELNAYNRTGGVDFNFASSNNKWSGKTYYHHSFEDNQLDSAFASGVSLSFSSQKWSTNVFSQIVGAGYNPEAGFVRRTDIKQLASTTRYSWFPEGNKIQKHGPGFDFDFIGNSTYGLIDWDFNFLYDISFRNTARFSMRVRRQFTRLLDSFDPSGADGLELPENSKHWNNQILMSFQSDARNKIFYELKTRSGEYYNGHRINLEGRVGYRYQPLGSTSIDFAFNRIILPQSFTTISHYLIGPRFDFTFTKSIFWTTFVQYNSQIDNLNINTRFQWRFKPVSDIFLVYTDNYFAYHDRGGFLQVGGPKTRALTFKITYWFNL